MEMTDSARILERCRVLRKYADNRPLDPEDEPMLRGFSGMLWDYSSSVGELAELSPAGRIALLEVEMELAEERRPYSRAKKAAYGWLSSWKHEAPKDRLSIGDVLQETVMSPQYPCSGEDAHGVEGMQVPDLKLLKVYKTQKPVKEKHSHALNRLEEKGLMELGYKTVSPPHDIVLAGHYSGYHAACLTNVEVANITPEGCKALEESTHPGYADRLFDSAYKWLDRKLLRKLI